MPPDGIPRAALRWTVDGRRKRGRPKETFRTRIESTSPYMERSHQTGCRQTEIRSGYLTCHLGTKRIKTEDVDGGDFLPSLLACHNSRLRFFG